MQSQGIGDRLADFCNLCYLPEFGALRDSGRRKFGQPNSSPSVSVDAGVGAAGWSPA